MPDINNPMNIADLDVQPPITGKVRLSDDMQQTLALLCGYAESARHLLKVTTSGVLNTCSARISDIVHKTAAGSPVNMAGDDIPCTEILCMGHPSNTGIVWVRPDAAATVNNAWPLAASESIILTIENMKQLNFLMAVGGEKLIIAYTR